MSKMRTVTLTCPKCGEQFEFNLYESVNATLDPELREKVINRLKETLKKYGE